MKINPIANNNAYKKTSFKSVHQYALSHYLQSKPFLNDYQEEKNMFLHFLKEQNKNKNYHICWDDQIGKYLICRLDGWTKYSAGGRYNTIENKEYSDAMDDLRNVGLPIDFDDINKAGEACNKLERVFAAKRPPNSEFFDYCI